MKLDVPIVDGPGKGQTLPVDLDHYQSRFYWATMPADLTVKALEDYDWSAPVPMKITDYYVLRYFVFGRIVLIASVHYNGEDVLLTDLFDAVLSDAVKKAVIP